MFYMNSDQINNKNVGGPIIGPQAITMILPTKCMCPPPNVFAKTLHARICFVPIHKGEPSWP